MTDPRSLPPVPAWLRFWAVLTLFAALPLVLLGAEVTTKNVGMVDQVGFRAPWLLFTINFLETSLGFRIEHGHRLAGFVVGTCCIVLALGLTIAARGWYRLLGWAALVAVGIQGILGIFRVNLNALFGDKLATIHGVFAQFVIAVLVSVAVLTSRTWSIRSASFPASLRRGALLLCALIFTQIVFGAIVRHLLDPLAQRLHILLAFVVLGTVFWLLARVRRAGCEPVIRRWSILLAVLVCIQPIFGVEAWIRRFGTMELPDMVPSSFGLDLARSGHHVLGTLIFATSIALAVLLLRPDRLQETAPAIDSAVPQGCQLEGVA
jgi:Cytochrome oxidase assembly protein